MQDLKQYLLEKQDAIGEDEIALYVDELAIFKTSEKGLKQGQGEVGVEQVSDSSDEELPVLQSLAPPSKGVWVVSTSRGVATLHIIGNCYRVPGKHYGRWTIVDGAVPMTSYKKACRSCFVNGHPVISKPEKMPLAEQLCEGMPSVLVTEEASDSSDSSSD